MKIAVLADIHANSAALEQVTAHIDAWAPDAVCVAGDLINRGPSPASCVAFVRARVAAAGWQVLKGNHEDYVLSHLETGWPRQGPAFEIRRNAFWTFNQLDQGMLRFVAGLPDEVSVMGPAGGEIRAVHASMIHNRAGIYVETPDAELRRKIAPPPAVFAAGHTHRPLIRRLNGTLVVNVGSVGLPFDGDPRAAYAQLTRRTDGWHARLIRLDYDRERTIAAYGEAGFLAGAGDLARIMLAELHLARSLIYDWVVTYQAAVLAHDIDITTAVDRYLRQIDD